MKTLFDPVRLTCAIAIVAFCGTARSATNLVEDTTGNTPLGWHYDPGEGVSFDEQSVVSAEFSLAFDSKYLSYGLVDNKDPILTPSASMTWFDAFSLGVEAIFDTTHYGYKAGYTDRAWKYTELHPNAAIEHVFSPDDFAWLPTSVRVELSYLYEYHPNAKARGDESADDDSQFWTLTFELPELWIEPSFFYERDVMRDDGTYCNLSLGHTFAVIGDDEDPTVTVRPSVAQGFGNTQRVRGYLTKHGSVTGDNEDGEELDHAGLMDTCVQIDVEWTIAPCLTLGGYVGYSDFIFDRKIREASRDYEAQGDWDHSWNFICGLAVTATF